VARGLFITFEGIEASGKTTQMHRAEGHLASRGVPVLATREPGGTPAGTLLRSVLLEFSGRLDAETELLLMIADRHQHLIEEIEPALAAGTFVLCDRYKDASRAYQGAGRGLGEATVDALHRRFCPRDPDRTYLFDCPVDVAMERLQKRGKGHKDRFEREELAFHRRVRAAYRRQARRDPRRFVVLDGTRPPDAVFARIARDLDALLAARLTAGRGAASRRTRR
jgi:dTMP kinase